MDPSTSPDGVARATLGTCLDEGIRAGTFPGGVVALRSRGSCGAVSAARGATSYEGGEPVDEATVYDLASLTKVVAALPLALLTVAAGRASLDGSLTRCLPELSSGAWGADSRMPTLRRLLSHGSGLPAWRPYFARLRGREAYLAAIASERPSYEPGSSVEYSDLGFILLGIALERLWDEPLPALARRLVFSPLGMETTGYRPAGEAGPGGRFSGARFAPTEEGNEFERGMALAFIEGRPVVGGHEGPFRLTRDELEALPRRPGAIRGEAHDANCHYGLSGVSGHAGLFSTAGDLCRYLAFWDEGSFLPATLRNEALRPQAGAGAIVRGLGWALDGEGRATHTGFTGTSLRYDPRSGRGLVALTNRVHPRVKDGIGAWREALAARVDALPGYGILAAGAADPSETAEAQGERSA